MAEVPIHKMRNLATVVSNFHVSAAELDRQFRHILARMIPKDMPDEPVLLTMVTAGRHHGESALDAAQRLLLLQALKVAHGQQRKAAQLLGVSPRVLNYMMAKWGMRPKDKKRSYRENTSRSASLADKG
jgi:transcriptional regulator with GAF, ATPase, and Fis domain